MNNKEALKWHRMNYQGFIETMWDGKEDNPFDEAFAMSIQALENVNDLRNELCLKCGSYTNAHKGACNGCRWEKWND